MTIIIFIIIIIIMIIIIIIILDIISGLESNLAWFDFTFFDRNLWLIIIYLLIMINSLISLQIWKNLVVAVVDEPDLRLFSFQLNFWIIFVCLLVDAFVC